MSREWQRCGELMPYLREPCARRAGHKPPHRSRYDLDNAYRAAVGHDRAVPSKPESGE